MDCKQTRQQIAELAQPTEHTAQCEACAKFLEERIVLQNAFAKLRAETASLGPSAQVEHRILAALRAPRTQRPTRWITASALAFAAILISAILFTVSRPQAPAPLAQAPQEEPFTAMPYVVPPAPYERTTMIRTQVSPEIMQYAGMDPQSDPGSNKLADVVYGQDGRILALRLVTHPNPLPEKRIN